MKRLVFAFGFIITALEFYGQITLQQTFNYSTGVVKLESSGYKYFLMDVPNSQCRIYNMDFTLFKAINCPVPADNYLADIKFVSQNLFNSDSNIELLYTYYQYIPTASSYYYVYNSKVINEYGSTLLTINGSRFNLVYKTGDTENKLFSFCYDYSVFPEIIWTNIYSLPGLLSTPDNTIYDNGTPTLFAYPNPADDFINLNYSLPDDIVSAKLYLSDSRGKTLKSFQIDGRSENISVNVRDMPPGIYLYYVEYNNYRTEAKKFVVR